MTDPDYDIIPTYHTDAINTDSWLMEDPYINEINEENPYGYTIEINAATAASKGLGQWRQGAPRHNRWRIGGGRFGHAPKACTQSASAVIGGHWGSKSAYMPIAKDKGVPVVHLHPWSDA